MLKWKFWVKRVWEFYALLLKLFCTFQEIVSKLRIAHKRWLPRHSRGLPGPGDKFARLSTEGGQAGWELWLPGGDAAETVPRARASWWPQKGLTGKERTIKKNHPKQGSKVKGCRLSFKCHHRASWQDSLTPQGNVPSCPAIASYPGLHFPWFPLATVNCGLKIY